MTTCTHLELCRLASLLPGGRLTVRHRRVSVRRNIVRLKNNVLAVAPAIFIVASCAKGRSQGPDVASSTDASCGNMCVEDVLAVLDVGDPCPDTLSDPGVNPVARAYLQL